MQYGVAVCGSVMNSSVWLSGFYFLSVMSDTATMKECSNSFDNECERVSSYFHSYALLPTY